ncbi:MAG: colicin E3/pyocin S6 family cytotoxin [Acetobacteraceae bacterium]
MGRKPIPRPSYLDECEYLGFVRGQRVWRKNDPPRLLTWDALHGEIEVFNLRGEHVGVADPLSGRMIGPAVRGRRIDV